VLLPARSRARCLATYQTRQRARALREEKQRWRAGDASSMFFTADRPQL
jgi:hypothetical protein